MRQSPTSDDQMREGIEALGVPRERQGCLWEARAKLIWGDRPADVERDLLAAGIDEPTVRAFMRLCLGERASAMRGKGLVDLAVGGSLLALGVLGGILISLLLDQLRQQMNVPGRLFGVLWAGCLLAGIYGGFRLVRGLDRVVLGARSEGAVVDVED